MDKIFKSFLFIIFIFSNIIAQTNDCNDVTKETRKVLNSGGVELYNAKLIGGCIDNKNTIHISLTLSSKYSFVLMESGLSKEQTAMTQTLEPFFTSVEKIYKKYPKVNNYILYFIYYEDIIDNYGNTTGKEKRIMTSMSMSSRNS